MNRRQDFVFLKDLQRYTMILNHLLNMDLFHTHMEQLNIYKDRVK